MPTEAEVLAGLDIDISTDPAEWVPDLLYTVRRMSCPVCERRPMDPVWTGSRWAVVWPHEKGCSEIEAGKGQVLKPAISQRRPS